MGINDRRRGDIGGLRLLLRHRLIRMISTIRGAGHRWERGEIVIVNETQVREEGNRTDCISREGGR